MTTSETAGDPPDRQPDEQDIEERERYRELLEELRTILPGVQVLFAFLLTAPFSSRFADLDGLGRDLYGVSLAVTALSAVIFLAPTSYHRVAPRRERRDRLRTGIRLTVAGMLTLAVAISVAVFTVMRFVFGTTLSSFVVAGLAGVIVVLWYVVPLLTRLGAIQD